MIQTVKGQGTGFTLDIDGRQYLVTAKHIVAGLQPEDTIQVRRYDASGNLKWVNFRMKIFMCDDRVDIAVLIPPEQLTMSTHMDPVSEGPVFGQDVYFVGFPFGSAMEFSASTIEITSPFGYVKRAMISSIKAGGTGEKRTVQYILDGHNIGGFSGSPVVYRPGGGNADPEVVAIMSSYTPDYGPVLTPKQIRREEATPDDYGKGRIVEANGHIYRLEEPTKTIDQRYVLLNTGIANAYAIKHAVDLIRLHPDGPRVAADFKPSRAR
jgi:hypothetical protein